MLERRVFSTADVPLHEQFSFWKDGFQEPVAGIHTAPLSVTGQGFRAEAEVWITPPLSRFKMAVENALVTRGSPEISRKPWDSVWVYRERGPGAWIEQNGREQVSATGDLIIADPDRSPFATRAIRDYNQEIWMVPRTLVAPHLRASVGPLWLTLNEGVGIGAILAAYLDGIGRGMTTLTPSQSDAVADNLSRLLAIAAGGPQAEHRQSIRTALLERVKQHIARHLTDPNLTSATAAAALGISLRTLHRAFEQSDGSFAEFVMRRRLAECRAALTSPLTPERSVADIAFGWGFQSLATFHRAFRREYGMAPGEAARRSSR